MSTSQELLLLLAGAQRLETQHEWIKAAERYRTVSSKAHELTDFCEPVELCERMGFCYHRAAMQAKDFDSFSHCMSLAVEAYEKAAGLFELEGKKSNANCCKAKMAYLNSCLAPNPAIKKDLLDKCWRLYRESLKNYEETEDKLNVGKICNELLVCLSDRFDITWNWQERKRISMETLGYGEKAIAIFSELCDDYELSKAYALVSLCYWAGWTGLEETKKEIGQRYLSYAEKALALSEKVEDAFLVGISNLAAGVGQFHFADNLELAQKHFREMLRQGKIAKENYLIGVSLAWQADITDVLMGMEEDPCKKREGYNEAISLCKEALQHLNRISLDYWLAQTCQIYAETCSFLACDVEINAHEKCLLFERAIEVGRKGVEYAERSGSPFALEMTLHALSKALYFLSTMETNVEEKKKLLEEASTHRENNINIVKQAFPFDYWSQGVLENYQALIRAELSKVEQDTEKKRGLLVKSALNMEKCLELCKKFTKLHTWHFAFLGKYHDWFARILNELYMLTEEKKILGKVIQIYEGAIETYDKADMPSRIAEAYWQIAKAFNRIGEYMQASRNFDLASGKYIVTAERISPLKEFYMDHSLYMQAWSEIERARHFHMREEYAGATQHYEKAAGLLQSSKLWSYLAPNFQAWALLEKGEDMSRKEKYQKAIEAFTQAAKLFNEARASLAVASSKIESQVEKDKAVELSRASDLRQQYCEGRTCLEEARILAEEGNYILSEEKYGSAAESFQRILNAFELEAERKELRPIISLCKAWQRMVQAEEKVSPELYSEASELFFEAKELSVKERTSILALGNSYLCKALEAGTRFEATRDMTLYSMAKGYMESAANYYIKAGFKKASNWVNANEALFDGFVYMGNAEIEIEPEKKKQLYALAEKCLDRSASLYGRIGYVRKKDEVLKILEKTKEKREFALSLGEILEAPKVASSTSLMLTPTPAHEEAVGLERFEHANIQVHFVVPEAIAVGQEFEIRLDLVNVGKNYALLVRINDVTPSGFKVVKEPDNYVVENGVIEMNGKRLEPLKIESLRFSVQTTQVGVASLNPKVTYVDESGEFRVCRPEVVHVTVHPPHVFQFKTGSAESVFSYLVNAFIVDYMKQKIYVEKSGWRSLVQIFREAKVPKTSVYGSRGSLGPAILELERRGLVETRLFSGERGRGGRILKARIAFEKETVKRYVDRQVMGIGENK